MALAIEIDRQQSSRVPVRPEHLVAAAKPVLQKTDAPAVGFRVSGRWTGGDYLEVDGQSYAVAYCSSALAVRESLDRVAGNGGGQYGRPQLILLTPLTSDDLGQDIMVRLARRRLLEMAPWELVGDLFRASTIDPRLTVHQWAARLLLDFTPPGGYSPVPGGVLDVDTAFALVLEHAVGLRLQRIEAEEVLAHSRQPEHSSRFRRLPPEVRESLVQWFGDATGRLGELLIVGIDTGHSEELLPLGLACEVIFAEGGSDRELAQAAVRLEAYVGGRTVDPDVGRQWAVASARVATRLDEGEQSEIFRRAEALLQEVKAAGYVALSSVLPSGYQRRLEGFGGALQAFLDGSTGADRVEEALDAVSEHRDAERNREPYRLERLHMAARLVRFLEIRDNESVPPGNLAEMSRDYLREGSFVDWARLLLLGGEQQADLGSALNKLSERVHDLREAENSKFAECFAAWNRNPGGIDGVVPVERVIEEVVAPMATDDRVLLLVLDGMTITNYRQLSEQLRRRGWEEWMPSGRNQRTLGLAVAPCITRLSRTSLFSGQITTGAGGNEKRHFKQHTVLGAVSKGSKPPLLFHKAELSEGAAGDLAEPVRRALDDPEQRVVGIVINVLDDFLSSSDQVVPRWTVDRIRTLDAILSEAYRAGRTMVLASDHGHVLEVNGKKLPNGEEQRWRSFVEPLASEEIVLEGPRIQAATGAPRIVVPWSERVRYRNKQAGYHGGATPQEMLVPLAILVPADREMSGWAAVSDAPPAWWALGVHTVEGEPERTPESPPSRRRPTEEPPNLFSPEPAEARPVQPPPDREPDPAAWILQLLKSDTYQAQRAMAGKLAPADEQVRAALIALDRNHGRASRSVLARAVGMPELRVPGLLAGLQRLLNVEGYPILSDDPATETVELNRDLLRRQFQL